MGTDREPPSALSAEAERWREVRLSNRVLKLVTAGDALAAALEARDRRIAELERVQVRNLELVGENAVLVAQVEREGRRIAELEAGLDHLAEEQDLPPAARRIARDLLAGRAPEPEDGFSERCDSCGRNHRIVWATDNALWNAVVGSLNGQRCPDCFDREAGEAGWVPIWRCAAMRWDDWAAEVAEKRRAAGGEG